MIEYRPAFGFGVWIGATVVDAATVQHGAISLAGLVVALTWALGWGWWQPSEPVDFEPTPTVSASVTCRACGESWDQEFVADEPVSVECPSCDVVVEQEGSA